MRHRISKGILRGLSFTGTYRWIGELRYSNTAGNRDLWAPAASVVDIGANYEFRGTLGRKRFNQSIRLTVKNIFDEVYITTSAWGPRRMAMLAWQIKH
jgi:outer membrane receptor protein involved in Fe transport